MTRIPGAGGAFTLIELLIVVAIISILASIAVPNFTEAQVRAKVARIQADMRTLMTGLESYMIDHNDYPVRHTPDQDLPLLSTQAAQMSRLTTPVAFLSSLPVDIFSKKYQPPNDLIDYWDHRQLQQFLSALYGVVQWNRVPDYGWMLVSVGPDGVIGAPTPKYFDYPNQGGATRTLYQLYDPTNGTVSFGNIYRLQSGRNPAEIIKRNR
jgi:type II secretion system protein G